jgi:hypothetical protein
MNNMTQEQYALLCNTCDKILSDSNASSATVAIPWLHVIREHPIFLSKYRDLFIPREPNYLKPSFIELKSLVGNIKRIFRGVSDLNFDYYANKPLPASVDFIFITHLISPDHASATIDFFYGPIPLELAKMGYSVAIAYVNMTKASSALLAKELPADALHRLIFTNTIGISEEIKMVSKVFKERKRLKTLAKSEPHNFFKRVLLAASRESISPSTIFSLRIGRQVARLISKISAKSLITIHEGHSWERLVFANAREVSSTINCIAYQHAVLFRLQHAIFRPLDKCYLPDQIIASGAVSFARLSHKFINSKISIRLGGSVRGAEHPKRKFEQVSSDIKRCIVLPEGIIEECKILYSFVLLCAALSPRTEFIFRLHPSVTVEKLKYSIGRKSALAPNVFLSTRSLPEDLVKCEYALYRGSSSIVQAVSNGLIPIYLSRPDELTIDPLFEIHSQRTAVSTPKDFLDVINNSKLQNTNQEMTIEYCNKIYSSININTFVDAHNFIELTR